MSQDVTCPKMSHADGPNEDLQHKTWIMMILGNFTNNWPSMAPSRGCQWNHDAFGVFHSQSHDVC